MALMDYASEADAYKRLLQTPEIGVTEAHYNAPAQAPASLASSQAQAVQQESLLEMPQSPLEQVVEKNGKAKTLGKMALTALSGGLLAPVLMPELMGAGKKYEADMEAYKKERTSANLAERISQIDFDNIQPEDIPYLELASGSLGEFGTDMLSAQMNGLGGDAEIAEAYGYSPYQWEQLSPEKKRDLSDRYTYQQGGEGAFDYRRSAEGKLPEQLQQAKESELYGSGLGQQLADDRQIITGAQSQVEMLDASASKIKGIREILEDNPDATGWNRVFRDAFNMNTETDGVLSEAEANGVVEQIKQATFGAISQAELDLLRQALMDPTKSSKFNIGTLSSALKTVQDKRKQTISAGRQAVDRYSESDTQNDFESLMKSDWAYNNIGGGSRIKPITKIVDGEEKTVTFSDYYKARKEAAGPYDDVSREQILVDYRKAREAEKEMWEKQQKVKADLQEEARRALELEFME